MASPKNNLFQEIVMSGDLKFNAMLLDIAVKLDQEDLRRLKFLLSGPNGVSIREVEKLTTVEDFFMCLKKRMMLTRDNLLLLQVVVGPGKDRLVWYGLHDAILRCDGGPVLDQPMTEFVCLNLRGIGKEYALEGTVCENGYIHAQFHVEGNLDRFQRSTLDKLRAYIAGLLDVPQVALGEPYMAHPQPTHYRHK
ncbi:poly [ADP-ribose] polymerase, partial [Plakobranchus ocellatus]